MHVPFYRISLCLLIGVCLMGCYQIVKRSPYADTLELAREATNAGDIEQADFYTAQYFSCACRDHQFQQAYEDIEPVLQLRSDLVPISFISGYFHDSFLWWFTVASLVMWGDKTKPDTGDWTALIVNASEGNLYCEVQATPRIETWSIIGNRPTPFPTTLIAVADAPILTLKDTEANLETTLTLETNHLPLHFIWTPKFHDLDLDSIPELWVRYNIARADGFYQVLEIFSTDIEKGMRRLHRFEGDPEGIAYHRGNGIIEVCSSYGSADQGHIGFDQYHYEMKQYDRSSNTFLTVEEKEMDHLLWGEDWAEYFIEKGYWRSP